MANNLNREYNLNSECNVGVKIGTVDRTNPKVIYLNCNTWVSIDEPGDYSIELSALLKSIKTNIRRILLESQLFDTKYIVDFDANGETFNKRKKKYLDITIYLKQKSEQPICITEIKRLFENTAIYIANEIEKNLIDNGFKTNLKKCNL